MPQFRRLESKKLPSVLLKKLPSVLLKKRSSILQHTILEPTILAPTCTHTVQS